MAAVLVLGPIIEADLPPEQHAYRPQRNALSAVRQVYQLLNTGHTKVIDADLAAYFGASGRSLMLPAGEIPASARGRAAPPRIEPWTYGGNEVS